MYSPNFHPMSDQELLSVASSIFATEPQQDVSDEYRFISTIDIVNACRDAGLVPMMARQNRTMPGSPHRGFQMHEVILAEPATIKSLQVDDTVPVIALTNSHNRSRQFKFDGGLHRLVCSNGMLLAESMAMQFQTRHIGEQINDILDGVFEVIEQTREIPEKIERYGNVRMHSIDQVSFASKAIDFHGGALKITPQQVLMPRRTRDADPMASNFPLPDLWHTLNVVQENITKGGIRTKTATGRNTTTKRITSIVRDHKFNKTLFQLAEDYAEALH